MTTAITKSSANLLAALDQTDQKQLAALITELVETKSLIPSQPIWAQSNVDWGFWDGNRQEMLELMAFYQRMDVVHGCVSINAKGVSHAQCSLMRLVNKGAGNLEKRGLRRIGHHRQKSLIIESKDLKRKPLPDNMELAEVVSHPLLDILHSNEEDQNWQSLRYLISASLDIYGISFCAKIRDNVGRVICYRYLPTFNITPERGEDGRIIGYFYSSTFGDSFTLKMPVALEDMIVFRWPSPTDPHAGGDSPLKSAKRKIELAMKNFDYQNWLMNNRARPDWALISDGDVGPDQAKQDEKRINDKFRGPGNGRVAVVPKGKQLIPLNWSPIDLAPLEIDDNMRRGIMFALGVPEHFFDNDSNRASFAEANKFWAKNGLAPKLSLIEHVLNSEAKAYDDNLLFVFENVIPEDRAQVLAEETYEFSKWQQALTLKAVTIDEFREMVLGLAPMPESEKPDNQTPESETIDQEVEEEQDTGDEEEAELVSEDEPAKAFDLVSLNEKVSQGLIDQATAINLVSFHLKISDFEAKKLVTHPPKKKRKAKSKTAPNTEQKVEENEHKDSKERSSDVRSKAREARGGQSTAHER